ncbi:MULTISPECIES: hypothetical protein [Ensifer]|jgi:hypothetical protein|uniref:Type I secretion protein n=1 Tax=Ensifer canadensis TaxID=555315 RepID=A0AAW4FX32_9HYPH|nr:MULTISPECIES: hypothetical protein [Ensifer]AHK42539.1 type I secretion system ATPase [Ensifer adhaerens OV14]KQU82191.1 hypothetical protein ASD00_09190 [Ensifer sp. Root31]KQW55505.1 hypothetical protein ASD02_30285 [Ensifer sp. Root1252]KQW73632.1 hypothetical protein ASD03_30340 [Ensifer sp. Root127]KQY69774.1 hypothetical protein ASD52_31895 [Ensifer sp. Root142]
MHTERVNEIIAHFIGLFEADTDEARLRQKQLEGGDLKEVAQQLEDGEAKPSDFTSSYQLVDYDPEVLYRAPSHDIADVDLFGRIRGFGDHFADAVAQYGNTVPVKLFANLGQPDGAPVEDKLIVHDGPGSVIAHVVQANMVRDDDALNMTDSEVAPRDTTYVSYKLAEFSAEAAEATPFAHYTRVDTFEGLSKIADDLSDYAAANRLPEPPASSSEPALNAGADAGTTIVLTEQPATTDPLDDEIDLPTTVSPDELPRDDNGNFALAADSIEGVYVNGCRVDEAPVLADFMPDRGLAQPVADPEGTDGPLQEEDDKSGNSVYVEAGANIVANIVSIVETGVIAPVTAVMGGYHQIDIISQSYAYADSDRLDRVLSENSAESTSRTVAMNIANFGRDAYHSSSSEQDGDTAQSSIFPNAWRVSMVEGDVSFVHWVEQYNFVNDNDTVTVTTTGVQTTALTGGNVAVNLASFLGLGDQYDLVIVGGKVLDLNMITQVAVFYDNDHISGIAAGNGMTVNESGNLIWNQASIQNIGANDRFEAIPDYIQKAVDNINDRIDELPSGFSHDLNFQGYEGLNILYITGNLYDVNVIKQISILGDADSVSYVASKILSDNPDADITIHTGANAVVNSAQIIDYDSFGHTTYVGGQVYSDAILIQAGLVDHDTDTHDVTPKGDRLANEVIAFIGDDDAPSHPTETVIDAGNDLSWSNGQWNDVMHTVLT